MYLKSGTNIVSVITFDQFYTIIMSFLLLDLCFLLLHSDFQPSSRM